MQKSVLDHVCLQREFSYIKSRGYPQPTPLCRLMSSFGSDKSGPFHNYTVVYDWLLSRFREENLAVFELGLGTNKLGAPSTMGLSGKPGASLRAWSAEFTSARIFGADIERDILFIEDRIETFWVDQREPQAIRALWMELEDISFDIMIDDGLHEASANICFFLELFRKLKPGGLYVIEDVTPNDTDLMSCFARCLAHAGQSVVFETLDHSLNKVDNRLLIFQK